MWIKPAGCGIDVFGRRELAACSSTCNRAGYFALQRSMVSRIREVESTVAVNPPGTGRNDNLGMTASVAAAFISYDEACDRPVGNPERNW